MSTATTSRMEELQSEVQALRESFPETFGLTMELSDPVEFLKSGPDVHLTLQAMWHITAKGAFSPIAARMFDGDPADQQIGLPSKQVPHVGTSQGPATTIRRA